jgi:hypothetical protein
MNGNYKNLIFAVAAITVILPSIFIIHNYIYNVSPLEKELESKDSLTIRESFKEKYDVEYDDLVTRKIYAFSIPASEIIPERNCHKFTIHEILFLPKDLTYVMDESTRELFPGDIQNGFYSGFSNPISFVDAKKLIERYDFIVTQKPVYDTLNKINDTKYHFECFFEDDKYQYKLGFDFDSNYAKGERLVFVNVTKNDQQIPIIENQNVRIFQGGFNGTVIFNNKLDNEITIKTRNLPPDGNWTDYRLEEEMTIPAGKVWSISPRNWQIPDDLVYQYTITPENLQGEITLKNYPRCMTENEVRSLYSQVEVYPKFPLYVPKGYSFECGVHNFNSFVHLGYWNDALREKYDDKVNAITHPEFFKDDGITIDYYDVFASNFWSHENDYDKFEKAKENAQHPLATTLSIAGQPAVMYQEYVWDNGTQQSYNNLQIFLDNEWYRIRSGLPVEELIKIAESIIEIK